MIDWAHIAEVCLMTFGFLFSAGLAVIFIAWLFVVLLKNFDNDGFK